MEEEVAKNKAGSVIVVGGGIGGMQASLDLADSGFYVYLVEEKSAMAAGWHSWIRHSLQMTVPCVSWDQS